jgi:LPS-assembly protein
LTSRVYTEGFWQKDYAVIESLGFQGITQGTDASTQSPWVAPHASFTHISSPGRWGDFWTLSTDTLTYARQSGVSASRLSNSVKWTLPVRDSLGGDWKVATSARADGYHSDGETKYGSNFSGRAIPLMSVNWSYPLINTSSSLSQTLTPMGMIAVSPNAGNPHRLPNEDSIDYELDDINIFQPNRTAGLDRVEEGVRGAYGVRWMGMTRHGDIQAQFAQGWRGHTEQAFNDITGYKDSLSDYMARVAIEPGGNFRIADRIRLDRDTLQTKRNEATVQIGPSTLRLGVSYYYFEKSSVNAPSLFGTRQQIYYNVNTELSRYWSFSAGYQEDLETHGGPISWRAKLLYNDECFALVGSVVRNFTYQNDYLSGITIAANVVLKSFGQMPLTLFSD